MYASTEKRILQVRAILREHYEPGRQDRSKQWVWRCYVKPLTGISRATFFRYLTADISPRNQSPQPRQLSLFE